jgi:Ca-activated chloride channel family protein
MNFIVREKDNMVTLNNQSIGHAEKYLIGEYDVEIPTIPMLNIDNAEILQSHTTTIEIPQPGEVSFISNTSGYGSLYYLEGKDQRHVYNLNPALRQQTIYLLPGFYRIVFRPGNSKMTLYTTVKEFEVESGIRVNIELY